MKTIITAITIAMLLGCNVETDSTVAAIATMKKQEIASGNKTLDTVQKKIDQAMQQTQQNLDRAIDADK